MDIFNYFYNEGFIIVALTRCTEKLSVPSGRVIHLVGRVNIFGMKFYPDSNNCYPLDAQGNIITAGKVDLKDFLK